MDSGSGCRGLKSTGSQIRNTGYDIVRRIVIHIVTLFIEYMYTDMYKYLNAQGGDSGAGGGVCGAPARADPAATGHQSRGFPRGRACTRPTRPARRKAQLTHFSSSKHCRIQRVADPWNFGMDPDPRIHTSDYDLMIEGSGSGLKTYGSYHRMRIRNTGRININPGVSLVVEPAPVVPAQLAGKRSVNTF